MALAMKALVGLGAAAAGIAVLWPLAVWWEVSKCERPKYRVLRTLGAKKDFLSGRPLAELREYAPSLVAEATISGTQREASSKGFRAIAGFIFGKQQAVSSEGSGEPTPIAMTSPVRMEMRGTEALPADAEGTVRMAFFMPSSWTKATLPQPAASSNVVVREMPAFTAAALMFRGRVDRAVVAKKAHELRALLAAEGLEPVAAAASGSGGGVILNQFYPPFTLALQRENEVLIEVEAPKQ